MRPYNAFRGNILFTFVSGEFQGDIAIPFIEAISKYKLKDARLQEEIEKYKQEVLEGLQIEEEGLTDYLRKKTKQDPGISKSARYNEPIGNTATGQTRENGPILKSFSTLNSKKENKKNQRFKEIADKVKNSIKSEVRTRNVSFTSRTKNEEESFAEASKTRSDDWKYPTR